MPRTVRYRVQLSEPTRHRVRIRAEFPVPAGGRVDLRLPVWSPGSYLVREYARNLLRIEARDRGGRRLEPRKIDKSTWRVEGARGILRVDYEMYGFERSVRTNHISSAHAFLTGPATFLYTDESRRLPAELRVEAPRGWKVACGLAERRGRFHARDYDELADSPIECGKLRELRFVAAGVPFRLAVSGPGELPAARLRADLRKIAETERELFGGFPFRSYLAILNLTPSSRGGLEHLASAALEWPRNKLRDPEKYEDFLALFAHELFHAWNVKSARPRALLPYDYRREMPTRLLWWFEGVTDYYDELLLRRAGLLAPRRYLDKLCERWDHLQETPGRHLTSVAGASFDSWIRFYRPDENSPNSSVSYYEKGHLVGCLLDLEIRRRTSGAVSLDDVAREIHERGRQGLPEDGVRRVVERLTKQDFGRWFERYVDGTEELPFARALGSAGLKLVAREDKKKTGPGTWLGATLRSSGGRLTLATVHSGGPADRAGLSAHDELVAADGSRIDESALRERLEQAAPGDRLRLSYFRDELLGEATVRLGVRPVKHKIVRDERARAAARARAESWLGLRWEDLAE